MSDKPPSDERASKRGGSDAASDGAGKRTDVGYKRPPPEHRIKPGERRNPKGRPKGSRNLKTLVEEVHNKRVRVIVDGKPRTCSAIEALVQRDMADALRGNERAIARHLALAEKSQEDADLKQASKTQAEISAEDEELLARYLSSGKKDP